MTTDSLLIRPFFSMLASRTQSTLYVKHISTDINAH